MLSTRITPTSQMFITLFNYFAIYGSERFLYTDIGDSYCVIVEPELVDIEKGKSHH